MRIFQSEVDRVHATFKAKVQHTIEILSDNTHLAKLGKIMRSAPFGIAENTRGLKHLTI